ncbi:membrane protein [Terrihabitans soli]|uniref:Protoporphyrinogen IX oxidase n=1 Tax=Terrihabitans soli TaxID=708113 RepID=A0A6S6QJD7_9HYPH|nr:protoporphyrinogen oxidase HemJ [Terrihabitans soli]BCJ89316.1 membrane protein [Terrihabitans soli]
MLFLWLKAFHIIAVVAWMAVLFYLPRLFVYHADAKVGSETSETFKVMERRLYRAIGGPASGATWILGLWLAYELDAWSQPWLHAKLLLVVLMTGFHHFCGATVKRFAADKNTRPARFYRIVNEVPTILLIGIVILVVVKPF